MNLFLIQYGFAGFAVMQFFLIVWIVREGKKTIDNLTGELKELSTVIKTFMEASK